jgi:hypothetical protein
LAVGTSCTTFGAAFGLKWTNIKAKKKENVTTVVKDKTESAMHEEKTEEIMEV